MAGIGFLALLDDITMLLDDVAVMTKVAAKKTAGVLGDDLALNAQQVSGVRASRELPVVWAVAKGSFINKLILVPLALLISYFLPWLVTPLLMLGGLYLCFEGVEKVFHMLFHKPEHAQEHQQLTAVALDTQQDMVEYEKNKIKGAIRTDFILSAEIIVIALGAATAMDADMLTKSLTVSLIAILITVFVYGLVAMIVKFDDAGVALIESADSTSSFDSVKKGLGKLILFIAPKFMRLLSAVGMAAMFIVGGGILVHGLPFLHHMLESIQNTGTMTAAVLPIIFNVVVGLIAGALVLAVVKLGQGLTSKRT